MVWATTSGYRGEFALLCALYALVALGMYVPFVMGGALSLAYAAYVLIGGYSIALIATKTGWWLGFAFPAAMAISAAVAIVLGVATLRLSGFHLVAVTLLFSVAFQEFLLTMGFTGGATGISGIRELHLFGMGLDRNTVIAVAILTVWLVAILLSNLRRSPFGTAIRSQRERRVAVEAAGVTVITLQLVALGVGAAISSLGGAFFVLAAGSVHPDLFTLELVFLVLFMPLLGGQFSPWGSVLGAVLVALFTFYLTFFKSSGSMFFALAVLAVILIAPGGVLGSVKQLGHRLLPRRRRE
ncbi:MAG: branched-chain amino acid ABC transporter permease [Gaiella sp.]|nr:branched-chain amino acid ABC transporter permease [Gaiella sp.]